MGFDMKKTKHIKVVKPVTTPKPGKQPEQIGAGGFGGGDACIPVR